MKVEQKLVLLVGSIEHMASVPFGDLTTAGELHAAILRGDSRVQEHHWIPCEHGQAVKLRSVSVMHLIERSDGGGWAPVPVREARPIEPQPSPFENPVGHALEAEFPMLWLAAMNADQRERMGSTVGQGDEEAARAMHELWMARTNLASDSAALERQIETMLNWQARAHKAEERLASINQLARSARSLSSAPEYDEQAIREALWALVTASLPR